MLTVIKQTAEVQRRQICKHWLWESEGMATWHVYREPSGQKLVGSRLIKCLTKLQFQLSWAWQSHLGPQSCDNEWYESDPDTSIHQNMGQAFSPVHTKPTVGSLLSSPLVHQRRLGVYRGLVYMPICLHSHCVKYRPKNKYLFTGHAKFDINDAELHCYLWLIVLVQV